jgi:hypothetical protein
MAWKEDAHFGQAQIDKIKNPNGLKTSAARENLAKRLRSLGSDYTFEDFSNILAAQVKGGGAATGTTGDENVLIAGINIFEYHILGTQTITSPAQHANGLNIGMDQTENDGVEIGQGIAATAKHAFTVGTSDPFFVRAKFSIADVSGTDDCAIGFRKAEAYQANIDDYDEMAALNVISGNITIETILNNNATVSTDTTEDWADTETHELEVRVDGSGNVTYLVDGVAPGTVAAFEFDTAEVVVPFMYFLHDAHVAGEVVIKEWECGYL